MSSYPWLKSIGTRGDGRRSSVDLAPMLSSSAFSSPMINFLRNRILSNVDIDTITDSSGTTTTTTDIPFAAIVSSDALGQSVNLSRLIATSLGMSPLRFDGGDEDENEEEKEKEKEEQLPTVKSWLASNPTDRRVLLVQDWISCPGERPHDQ